MGVQQFKFKANRPKIVGNTNIKPYWQVLEKIIGDSDIIFEVLDARMPEISRNEELEKLIKKKNKEIGFILNKTDLISESNLNESKKLLLKEGKTFAISSKNRQGLKELREYLLGLGKNQEWFNIGIVGYPNTGKSTIINALVRKKKSKVSSKAGTTHGQQWIKFRDNVRIIDSPGIVPVSKNDEIRLALIGSKNPEKIKNLELVANKIISLFKDKTNIEKIYNVKNLEDNPEDIIEIIGRKKGFLKKGNEVDESRVSIQIIRDWQTGKLKL